MPAPILAAFAAALPLLQVEHALVLENVYLNDAGPFRMLIDTGAQTSAVTPEAARRAGVSARFRVEHVSAAGSQLMPGTYLNVRAGSGEERGVESMICELAGVRQLVKVDGVLGQSWLGRFDYLIDLRKSVLVQNAEAPASGLRLSMALLEGRPAIPVRIDGEPVMAVLDSGAPVPVLPGGRESGDAVLVSTNAGSAAARRIRVRLGVADRDEWVDGVSLPGFDSGALLPVRLFRWMYVSNTAQFIILGAR